MYANCERRDIVGAAGEVCVGYGDLVSERVLDVAGIGKRFDERNESGEFVIARPSRWSLSS